jgi:uncharacterized membrane protein YbaN (DUF454 family)
MTNLNKKDLFNLIKKVILVWSGICSLLIGFVLFFIPFLPGFIFGIIGLILIGRGSRTVRRHYYFQKIRQEIKIRLRASQILVFKKLIVLL